jgi:hypothetical protein
MKLGTFSSYSEYREAQIAKNLAKINAISLSDRELAIAAKYIRQMSPPATFGICHGVRNGYEVKKFRQLLKIDVIGTEISPSATRFPNVIEWDFHEVKSEWKGNVDFIYSNSWDHSYDPDLLFSRWLECLRPSGMLFIQWTAGQADVKEGDADCFGATLPELIGLLNTHGVVRETISFNQWAIAGRGRLYGFIRSVVRRKPVAHRVLIVIQKRSLQLL